MAARLRAQRKVVGGRSSLGVKPERYSPLFGPTSTVSAPRKSGASAKSPSAAASRAARVTARCRLLGLGDADHATGQPPARVAGRLRLEVVGLLVDDHAPPQD